MSSTVLNVLAQPKDGSDNIYTGAGTNNFTGIFQIGGVTVTSTAAELNIMDGLLATTAELNRAADVSTRLVLAGATLTATELLHDGKIVLLDQAAGSVVTLPAASGSGTKIKFVVSTTATSNDHIIETGSTDDHMTGFINNSDQDVTVAGMYKADGATDDTVTMNRTTTGGILGDTIEATDIATNLWLIEGKVTCVAGSNIADPFSAAVS